MVPPLHWLSKSVWFQDATFQRCSLSEASLQVGIGRATCSPVAATQEPLARKKRYKYRHCYGWTVCRLRHLWPLMSLWTWRWRIAVPPPRSDTWTLPTWTGRRCAAPLACRLRRTPVWKYIVLFIYTSWHNKLIYLCALLWQATVPVLGIVGWNKVRRPTYLQYCTSYVMYHSTHIMDPFTLCDEIMWNQTS